MSRPGPRTTLRRASGAALLVLAAAAGCKTQGADAPAKADDRAEQRADEAPKPAHVTLEIGLVDEAQRRALAERLGPESGAARAAALLALRHRIREHWHIYWRNPGETGLATRIELDGKPAEVLYPAPSRFVADGGQISYGWEDGAVLFLPLAELDDDATITVRSRWLACRESCIPGDSEASATRAELPRLASDELQAMVERVPEPAGDRVEGRWAGDTLILTSELGELGEFFPYAGEALVFTGTAASDDGLELRYRRLDSGDLPPGQGVIEWRADDGQAHAWLELSLPWSPSDSAPSAEGSP